MSDSKLILPAGAGSLVVPKSAVEPRHEPPEWLKTLRENFEQCGRGIHFLHVEAQREAPDMVSMIEAIESVDSYLAEARAQVLEQLLLEYGQLRHETGR